MMHSFHIVAPALGNYSSELLRIVHDPVNLYPVQVRDVLVRQNYGPAADAEDLKKFLREIFQSKSTRELLKSLLSQIADVKPAKVQMRRSMQE